MDDAPPSSARDEAWVPITIVVCSCSRGTWRTIACVKANADLKVGMDTDIYSAVARRSGYRAPILSSLANAVDCSWKLLSWGAIQDAGIHPCKTRAQVAPRIKKDTNNATVSAENRSAITFLFWLVSIETSLVD